LIRTAFGTYAETVGQDVTSKPSEINKPNSHLIQLFQARYLIVPEASQSKKVSSSVLKDLSGNGTLTMTRKFKDEQFQFRMSSVIEWEINQLPRFDIVDCALTDRIRVIPYTQSFNGDELMDEFARTINAFTRPTNSYDINPDPNKWSQRTIGAAMMSILLKTFH